jgi:phosphatidylinositol 4-kinase
MLGGIIEVIPNSYSRDQLGKAFELDLYKYFLKRYGSETSEEFRFARLNFVKSLAAYCVVSYILQIKDRHNGNIMIDDSGHLIHIDFGFIFDWSPGKDMRFERSNFKLTQEFMDIMGGPRSESFHLFVTRVVQGFLAVRRYSEEFVNLTELMHFSGFPCFKPPSLTNLEWRFRQDLDDMQAATYMRGLIEHARTTWTTGIYDFFQYRQNKIVF